MARLRVTSTALHGTMFALDGEHFTIGRAPDNHLRLGHSSISQHHAMITVNQGEFKLQDLHSTNGTFINGERTAFRCLQDGDRLVLGEIQLQFELTGTAPPQPPPPVEVSLGETQLLTGMVRKPRSQTMPVRAAQTPAPRPAPNTVVAVITPPTAPVAAKKEFVGFLSRLQPPATAVHSNHKELRETMTTPVTKSCVEMPPSPAVVASQPVELEKKPDAPANAAAKAGRQRLIALIILMVGGIMLGVGHSSNNAILKILGCAGAITGFIALLLAPRD